MMCCCAGSKWGCRRTIEPVALVPAAVGRPSQRVPRTPRAESVRWKRRKPRTFGAGLSPLTDLLGRSRCRWAALVMGEDVRPL